MLDYTEIIHVAETGSDTTGDGSIGSPYSTLATAISAATTESPLIKLGEGTFDIEYLYGLGVSDKHMMYEGEGESTTILVLKAKMGNFAGPVNVYDTIIKPSDSFTGETRVLSYTKDTYEVNFYNCLFKPSDNLTYPTTALMFVSSSGTANMNKNFYNCTVLDMGGVGAGVANWYNSVFIRTEADTTYNTLTDCLNNDPTVTIDDEYKLSGETNLIYGVHSGEYTWSKKLCFILQDGKYYTILDDHYNGTSYDEISLSEILSGYESLCFNIYQLTKNVTINDETFRPIDKFTGNIQIVTNEACYINVCGLKTNKELILANGHFTTKLADNIDFFNLDYAITGNGSIRCAVSDNYGTTWKTWDSDSSAWTLLSTTPPIKSYASLTDEELVDWNTFLEEVLTKGYIPTQNNTLIDYNSLSDDLMFAYAIARPSYSDDASMTSLEYQFDAKGYFEKVDSDSVNITQTEDTVTVAPKEDISLLRVNIGSSGTVNVYNGSIGEDGEDGKSASDIWLSLGNQGTEEDFINSLKGADGNTSDITFSVDENGILCASYDDGITE